MRKLIWENATVSDQAYVEGTCQLGEGVIIYQFASLSRGVRLGKDCRVWPNVTLDGSVYGDRCKIASGFTAGAGFLIGDDCFLGPGSVICNDRFPFTDRTGYDDESLRSGEKFTVILGDRVCLGANSTVLPGIRIGSDVFIAAGATVDRDIPDNHIFQRNGYLTALRPGVEQKRMKWIS